MLPGERAVLRIALISDIHGNRVALEAVLEDITRLGCDQTVCLGDVATLGPEPVAVAEMLADAGISTLLGNHEEFLLQPETIQAYTSAPTILQAVDWCREQLPPEVIASLDEAPFTASIDADGLTVELFHGSPRSVTENLLSTTPEGDLDDALEGIEADAYVSGHTHIQMVRQHRGRLLLNPGSVGMPFERFVNGGVPKLLPHAEYATVDLADDGLVISSRRVELDLRALGASVEGSDTPLGPWLREQWGA